MPSSGENSQNKSWVSSFFEGTPLILGFLAFKFYDSMFHVILYVLFLGRFHTYLIWRVWLRTGCVFFLSSVHLDIYELCNRTRIRTKTITPRPPKWGGPNGPTNQAVSQFIIGNVLYENQHCNLWHILFGEQKDITNVSIIWKV